MRIGYPCINRTIGCIANSTFRLRSYSIENLYEKVSKNLNCLKKILKYNVDRKIFFFRIGSELIPFASHPVNKVRWWEVFQKEFLEIGRYIKKHKIRIGMHPDQFVLINAKDKGIVKRSILELKYHARVLDSLGLDSKAKVQIHVGGVYGDKKNSIKRFVMEYRSLPSSVRRRLCIENDDVSYSLFDCCKISKSVGIPIIFDTFHHEINNCSETVGEAFLLARKSWKRGDGIPIVDYSSQQRGAKKGAHAHTIDIRHFKKVIGSLEGDFDVMLEIKDKEKSALRAIAALENR